MAVSISLPFSFTNTGAVSTTSVDSKLWADRVLGCIFTTPQDRVMRPTYGSFAGAAAFEPETEVVEFVTRTVSAAFTQYLPSLTLLGIYVTTDDPSLDNQEIIISVDYELPNKQVSNVTTKVGTFTRTGELIQEIQ